MSDRKCVNCRHNKRIPKQTYIENRCEIDNHYIGYNECFTDWCRHWAKDHTFDEAEEGRVMYESPIMVNVTDPIFESINKVQDEYVIRACQTISADINQEELIKALQYDRRQYEKGYADGLAYKPPVETNADHIRAMSDEELAEFCFCITDDVASYYGGDGYEPKYPVASKGWLDWLREEIKE